MKIRKIFTHIEEARSEAGVEADLPLRKVAVVTVVSNPFAGKDYQADLQLLTDASVAIGRQMGEAGRAAMDPYEITSYGKGGVVGTNGEQEHIVAMLTTVFGNEMRDAVGGGKAWISSFTKRAAPGMVVDIPLAHKDALYVRSHYDGMSVLLADAPLPDEIALICVFSNRGRLNARVGGIDAANIRGDDGLH